jgi:hypothetical protein
MAEGYGMFWVECWQPDRERWVPLSAWWSLEGAQAEAGRGDPGREYRITRKGSVIG